MQASTDEDFTDFFLMFRVNFVLEMIRLSFHIFLKFKDLDNYGTMAGYYIFLIKLKFV